MTTTKTVPYSEYVKATDELLALRAENERLRVALENIAAMSEPAGYQEASKALIRHAARAALSQT